MRFFRFLLFFGIIVFCVGCKKYPEDPFETRFQNKKNKFYANSGYWLATSVIINGIDSTDRFRSDSCRCNIHFMNANYNDGGGTATFCNPVYTEHKIDWGLDYDKNLVMRGILVYPKVRGEFLTHYIQSLNNGVLKFKVTHPDNGKEYYFEFVNSN